MNPCLRIWRTFAVVVAVLVMVGSIAGIVGTWWVHSAATNATLQAFTIVDSAVGVVDTGAERVNGLVQIGRNEVQQVETTIVAVGSNITENRPVLTALSTRVSERLSPTVEQVRTTVAPLVATVRAVRALVDFVNAIPFIREAPPGIEDLENALNVLDEAVADVRQINDTVRTTVTGTADRFTNESVSTLTGLTSRVDSRLSQAQAAVGRVQVELRAFQQRLAVWRSRLLLAYNLTAIGLTLFLFLVWVVYSQVVFIRHQRQNSGKARNESSTDAPPPPQPEAGADGAP